MPPALALALVDAHLLSDPGFMALAVNVALALGCLLLAARRPAGGA